MYLALPNDSTTALSMKRPELKVQPPEYPSGDAGSGSAKMKEKEHHSLEYQLAPSAAFNTAHDGRKSHQPRVK